ncbi:MAG TPA: hydroxymethylglutaryl-CoA lyase [Acidimicrobiales bacterium]|nr:hydroxymethylglutaryl-CoA lyase [Acidimicrobiales bacterium]
MVREVGPRDGLQPEAPIAIADRVALIDALLAAGVTSIEAVAFVSPSAVPAMAGAAEVLAEIGRRDGVVMTALVPNPRGAEMAASTGVVDELTATISISETYNQRNVHMSTEESVGVFGEICSFGLPVDAVVSCAFGSPYEGDIAPADVASLCGRLRREGAARISLADTTGMATPRRIVEVVAAVDGDVGLHLHETRGTGLVNAYAGLEVGVRRFDTSVGGLGGSPFAAGAAGNVATEGLVALLDDLGYETGIDVDAMCEAAALVGSLLGRDVPSPVAHAGPRSRLAIGER